MKDVHTEHCCLRHGCKYCDEDCTVVSGEKEQSFTCEACDWELEDPQFIRIKELENSLEWILSRFKTLLESKSIRDADEVICYIEKLLSNK